jgi:hypothetical protein
VWRAYLRPVHGGGISLDGTNRPGTYDKNLLLDRTSVHVTQDERQGQHLKADAPSAREGRRQGEETEETYRLGERALHEAEN